MSICSREGTPSWLSCLTSLKELAKLHDELGELPSKAEMSQTLGEFLEAWYQTGFNHNGDPLKLKTIDTRRVNIARINRTKIAKKRLMDIRTGHVTEMVEELRNLKIRNRKTTTYLSDSAVKQAYTVVHKALQDAQYEGLISINPVDRIKNKLRTQLDEKEIFTKEELKQILAYESEWSPLYTLLAHAGIRIGEAMALKWSDFTLPNTDNLNIQPLLKISRAIGRVTGHGLVVDTPKSTKSVRSIGLSSGIVEQLKTHEKRQKQRRIELKGKWNWTSMVFPNEIGEMIDGDRPYRELMEILAHLGIHKKGLMLHTFRHTCASILISEGKPAPAIQRLLGHAHLATTMNTYVHWFERKGEEPLTSTVQSVLSG